MLEIDEHAPLFMPRKRGLEPRVSAALKESIANGKQPKEAVKQARRVALDEEVSDLSPPPKESSIQKELKRARDIAYRLNKVAEESYGLQTTVQLLEYLELNKATKESFDAEGAFFIFR